MIDITMTATCRPDILRATLKSFYYYMFAPSGIPLNLIINIDPVGPKTQEETLAVCREFHFDSVQYNLPETANFPKAFIWTWQMAVRTEAGCIFHLEDDWELLRPVKLNTLFLLLHLYPDLSILRLNAFQSAAHLSKQWDKMIYWNGTFFEVPPNLRGLLGFAGHPSLVKKEMVKLVLPYLDDGKNPEKQINGHHKVIGPYLLGHRFGVFSEQNSPPLIRDIGRKWMTKQGYRKAGGNKAWFTKWERAER